ncbi:MULTISPECIES: HD domain-containing protein [Methanobacterium]|uniref:HD domain-containing protein n=1 Tax=Methanobacterium spitsbergense TaxID=2874285 RepID=A0A8T5UT39_9EURY|nr:HD domain-containing protein [Methanobacterium sp. SMA-27]MBZ2166928.1 HD domain-containing protein [Methanobacterium spitsbergense]
MKFIRDSLHGNLQLNEFEVKLIDTPQIQRLRRIKQLGFTYLVYPGANHTRFEHSIGAMYLASKLTHNLDLSNDQKEMLRVCALLHDAGHGPFSHVSESVLEKSHEELTSKLIMESHLSDILEEKFDPKEIIKLISGEGRLGQIISGDLDVDRMDYLLRDSYYTGVAYGVIDVERLIYNMKLEDNLILKSKGVQAAESMLLARYFMYPSVYQHHTTRIINSMFRRCINHLFTEGHINPENIYKYDDLDIIIKARYQKGFIGDMMHRLDNRKLFKSVYSLKLDELENPNAVFKIKPDKIKSFEMEISEELNIPEEYVIVDVPDYPSFDEMKTQVSSNGDLINLSEISTIVSTLRDARFNHADLCVYLPEENSNIKDFQFQDYIEIPK